MNEEVQKQIEELETRISKLEKIINGSNSANENHTQKRSQLSVVEFFREKKPASSVDKALVFAVYHEIITGQDVFNTEDLLSLWRQAKETPPANINDLINKNIKKGYIAEEKVEKGQKKSWYVTATGNNAVNNSFQK